MGKQAASLASMFVLGIDRSLQEADRLRRVRSLAREAACSYDTGDEGFPGPNGVDSAVLVPGSQEPDEWWNAFESAHR